MYGFTITLVGHTFDQALAKTLAALKAEGFGAAIIDSGWMLAIGSLSKTIRALGKSVTSLSMLACAALQWGH